MEFRPLSAGLAAVVAALQPLSGTARAQSAPQAEAPAPGDGAAEGRRAEPIRPLATFFSDLDYPAEAIARREQGAVRIRLSVDREGRVAGCSVEDSSGSSALDVTSCQLLSQRARFRPARDGRGEPVFDTQSVAIRWVLPAASHDSIVETAYQAWVDCALTESARHARTRLSIRSITRRALAQCGRSESEVTRVLGTELEVIPVRNSIRQAIAHQIGQLRRRRAPASQPAPRNQ